MKEVVWLGDSRKILREFPDDVQDDIGYQLMRVQFGLRAVDAKPMPSVGAGIEEIRVWGESGTYRMIYMARLPEAVYVLHAFQKKTHATSQRDLNLAETRFKLLLKSRSL